MKLSAPALLTLSALATSAAADDARNRATCQKANPDIVRAIDAFCNKPEGDTIMIPSAYANTGKKVGDVKVSVQGKCKPPQWLPKKWCLIQFHQICGLIGFGGGFGGQTAGRNSCQEFYIESPK